MSNPEFTTRRGLVTKNDVIERAKTCVEGQPYFAGRSGMFEFDLDPERRVMVVRGSVPTFYLKQLLQAALKKLDCVRQIDNQVSVDPSEGLGIAAEQRSQPYEQT